MGDERRHEDARVDASLGQGSCECHRLCGGNDVVAGPVQQIDRRRRRWRERRRERRITAERAHVGQQDRPEVLDVPLVDVLHQRPRRLGE